MSKLELNVTNLEKGEVKKTSTVSKVLFSAAALTSTVFAAPLAAPDTTDIVTTIVAFGGAAVLVKLGYIIYPIVMKTIGLLRS